MDTFLTCVRVPTFSYNSTPIELIDKPSRKPVSHECLYCEKYEPMPDSEPSECNECRKVKKSKVVLSLIRLYRKKFNSFNGDIDEGFQIGVGQALKLVRKMERI